MFSTEQIAIKRAAAAALLNVHWDRISVGPVDLSVWVDDQPTQKMEAAIIALKAMLMEWIGWGAEHDLTTKLTGQQPVLRRVLERVEPVAIAGLAVDLRGQHGT